MFRWAYHVGLLLGAVILALFMGAKLIHLFDPYRIVTEELIQQVAAEPQRTVRLYEYGTLAGQQRQMLHTEQATAFADWLDQMNVQAMMTMAPASENVVLIVNRVDTAVHEIADFDNDLTALAGTEKLSHDLAHLQSYDLERGDMVLADLYQQSLIVSRRLADISRSMGDAETAIFSVTHLPMLESILQGLRAWRDTFTSVASNELPLTSNSKMLKNATRLNNFIYWSTDSWQDAPAYMKATKLRLDIDVNWLDAFEQKYEQAKAVNDRLHFDMLRSWPRFVATNYWFLLVAAFGSLLLTLVGWIQIRISQIEIEVPSTPPLVLPPFRPFSMTRPSMVID